MTLDLFGDRGAVLSSCGRYRFRLWRSWSAGPRLGFVMLNPSTADAEQDDPTIRRCVGFARDLGLAGIEVVNLFPWRATRPADLAAAVDALGVDTVASRKERDAHVLEVAGACSEVVAAWGAHKLAELEYSTLPALDLVALGLTASGAPRHPLYLPRTARPFPWPDALPSRTAP